MPLPLVLAQIVASDLVAAALARTAAEDRCPVGDTADVTVCSRRNADRFRVPLVERASAPSRDAEPGGRAALFHRTTPVQGMGPFLVESGFAGLASASASVRVRGRPR